MSSYVAILFWFYPAVLLIWCVDNGWFIMVGLWQYSYVASSVGICLSISMGISMCLVACQSVDATQYPQQVTGLPVQQAVGIAPNPNQAYALAKKRANKLCNTQQTMILKQEINQHHGTRTKKNSVFGRVGSVVGNIFGQSSYRQVQLPEYQVLIKFQCQSF